MAVTVTNVSNLDPTVVDSNLALLQSYLASAYPSMDTSVGGVLYSLLLRPAAIFHTLNQTNMTNVQQSNSLAAINANPALADPDLIAAVLSNYNTTINPGSPASGVLTLTFTTNSFVAIPPSVQFTANGIVFSAPNPVYGVASNPNSSTNVVFVAQPNGTYTLQVPVTAQTNATAGDISQNTPLSVVNVTLANLINVFATNDFSGGTDPQSATTVVASLANGLTTPSLACRPSIRSLLQNEFPTITDVSVIGAGDVEMLRDSHSTLGIKTFGKVDVYVRTNPAPLTVTSTINATLTDVNNKYFSINFDRNTYPSLYYVKSILPVGSNIIGSLPFNSVTRGLNTTLVPGTDFVPSMINNEGVFTRYQTMTVTFTSATTNTTGLSVGAQVPFSVTVSYMPNITNISDWVENRSQRPPGGDYLIKAPIPCYVSVGMTIVVGNGDSTPDTSAITAAIVNVINSTPFAEGQLGLSPIVKAAQSLLGGTSYVQLPLDLRGMVIKPDGSEYWMFGPNALVVPTLATEMVSPRTVAFYADSGSVIVNAVPTTTPVV